LRLLRIAFWLLLLPAGLLYFALCMNQHVADVQSGALEEREYEQRMATSMAAAERGTEAYLQRRFEERILPAQACVERAIRGFGNAWLLDKDVLVLLVASGDRCGEDCSGIAAQLAKVYAPQGLHVLLLETATESRSGVPEGISQAHLPDCSAMVRDYGDDYLFRSADGELSSFGHRTQRFGGAFDPEAMVRERLGLAPLPSTGLKGPD
jgi:hypothetical protein